MVQKPNSEPCQQSEIPENPVFFFPHKGVHLHRWTELSIWFCFPLCFGWWEAWKWISGPSLVILVCTFVYELYSSFYLLSFLVHILGNSPQIVSGTQWNISNWPNKYMNTWINIQKMVTWIWSNAPIGYGMDAHVCASHRPLPWCSPSRVLLPVSEVCKLCCLEGQPEWWTCCICFPLPWPPGQSLLYLASRLYLKRGFWCKRVQTCLYTIHSIRTHQLSVFTYRFIVCVSYLHIFLQSRVEVCYGQPSGL